MFKARHFALLLLLLPINYALAEAQVNAQQQTRGDVVVELKQFKVVHHNGTDKLTPVERIKPGETIQYQATYNNVSQHAVHDLQATLPIPEETEYLPGTAKPAGVMASIDGKSYAPVPLHKKVLLANGESKEVEIPASQYRDLRWTVGDLKPGQKISVNARVHLAPVGAAKEIKK